MLCLVLLLSPLLAPSAVVFSSNSWNYLKCSPKTVVRFPKTSERPAACPPLGLYSIGTMEDDVFYRFRETLPIDVLTTGKVVGHVLGPTLLEQRFGAPGVWTWDRLGYYGARMVDIVAGFHEKGFALDGKFTPDMLATHVSDPNRLSPVISSLVKASGETRKNDFKQILCNIRFLFDGGFSCADFRSTSREQLRNECADLPAKFSNLVDAVYRDISINLRAEFVKLMGPTHLARLQGPLAYLGAAWGAPKQDVFLSLTRREVKYLGCAPIGRGTEGYVVTAIEVDPGENISDKSCTGTLVVKCDSHQSLANEAELLLRFSETASSLIDRASWVSSKPEDYPLVPSYTCLVLKLFGPTLRDLRVNDGTKKWSWDRLGHLGARMVEMIAEFHEAGFYHRDFHPGNIVTHKHKIDAISPIDLGAMTKFTTNRDIDDYRKVRLNERLTDLRQIVCNIRSLWDGTRTYYAEKRTNYAKVKAGLEVAGIPAGFKAIVNRIYTITDESHIDYARLRRDFAALG